MGSIPKIYVFKYFYFHNLVNWNSQSMKWNLYFIFSFLRCDEAKRSVEYTNTPLTKQNLQKSVESGERHVLTLGSLYPPALLNAGNNVRLKKKRVTEPNPTLPSCCQSWEIKIFIPKVKIEPRRFTAASRQPIIINMLSIMIMITVIIHSKLKLLCVIT